MERGWQLRGDRAFAERDTGNCVAVSILVTILSVECNTKPRLPRQHANGALGPRNMHPSPERIQPRTQSNAASSLGPVLSGNAIRSTHGRASTRGALVRGRFSSANQLRQAYADLDFASSGNSSAPHHSSATLIKGRRMPPPPPRPPLHLRLHLQHSCPTCRSC